MKETSTCRHVAIVLRIVRRWKVSSLREFEHRVATSMQCVVLVRPAFIKSMMLNIPLSNSQSIMIIKSPGMFFNAPTNLPEGGSFS